MDGSQQNLITRTGNTMKIINDALGLIDQIDTLYNGTPNYSEIITQAAIDSVPSLKSAGLTKSELDAGIYILKQCAVQLRTINLPAVVVLANLG